MKTLNTILAAAFIAGSAGLAMAQGSGAGASGGGSASGGADSTQQGTLKKDADTNPTGPGANPQAGNTGAQTTGSAKSGTTGGAMKTAPVSGTPSKDSSTPTQAPTADKK